MLIQPAIDASASFEAYRFDPTRLAGYSGGVECFAVIEMTISP